MTLPIKTRTDFEGMIIRLSLRGPVTNRQLWDECWSARIYLGEREAEKIAREIATPDQEPPQPDTRWRLK